MSQTTVTAPPSIPSSQKPAGLRALENLFGLNTVQIKSDPRTHQTIYAIELEQPLAAGGVTDAVNFAVPRLLLIKMQLLPKDNTIYTTVENAENPATIQQLNDKAMQLREELNIEIYDAAANARKAQKNKISSAHQLLKWMHDQPGDNRPSALTR